MAPFSDHTYYCLSLEHLAYRARSVAFSHPSFAYIDVWVHPEAVCQYCGYVAVSMERVIPSGVRWKNVRLLDDTLRRILRLPELFPPGTTTEQVPCVHAMPVLDITHAAHCVYCNDVPELQAHSWSIGRR